MLDKIDLIIFADEIYDRLVMDGKKHTAIVVREYVFCVSMNISLSHVCFLWVDGSLWT
ncbi:MAG: hypothetical protein ACLRPQ_03530 [Streptococcus sp.]